MPDMPIIPIRAAVLRKPDRLLKICCTSVTSTKITSAGSTTARNNRTENRFSGLLARLLVPG
jgi:hypothetical protein